MHSGGDAFTPLVTHLTHAHTHPRELPGNLRSRVAGLITGGVLMQLPLFQQMVEEVAAEEGRGVEEYSQLKEDVLGTVAKNLLPLEVLPGEAWDFGTWDFGTWDLGLLSTWTLHACVCVL